MYQERIRRPELLSRVMSADEAAALIKNKMVVGSSGFTKAGDSKAVLQALGQRAKTQELQISLITGASLGHNTDGNLANAHLLSRRMPFQADPILRDSINKGEVLFIDQHLGETAELLNNKHLPEVDIAVLEATLINEDGSLVLTTSVGNSAVFAALAKQIIVEINTIIPVELAGIHDIFYAGNYPHRQILPVLEPHTRIGTTALPLDPDKIVAIVITHERDSPAQIVAPDEKTSAIAGHLLEFFNYEVKKGRLTTSLLPLQAGIGKVANAVLNGFTNGDFHDLTMYSEVLQDSTFDLMDAGKMTFASASSITISSECYDRVVNNIGQYKDRLVLRPQNISNAAEIIRRLGIIAINTAIEFDIYGNVNSTHINGTNMMNGIGGSGDFARNAYLSIFVCQSASKGNSISHVLPMVSHTDHTEHDVDILVTDNGLADLRGLAPRERAKVIIDNCAHPEYRDEFRSYFKAACARGGHTPHILEEAFTWHNRFRQHKDMRIKQEAI
ncbi:acetyl-CoA hydrolase/succinyl-CoA:acetate CoA-transferase [Flexibacter flexilis DSM 6793]|uniref:Acetyl-CoA hydrolase/succinyl-CoA:acetate CoA-transferase n=1 Tax=Flexibacter flexilis DSM 6793 TaxID=927664 RepID=A0A1I1DLI0_9BACT|nr:succinate CoA transferase [Flexibacter flexilis]SFB75222.1 acetyl-CoA hydrolase/succinyl-CoA:acetate CoA-transferase [Flexibacter flexilis DSM 6793]